MELTEQDTEENTEEDESKGRTRNKYQWAKAIFHMLYFQVELFNYFM
jgi:hypothetical protein